MKVSNLFKYIFIIFAIGIIAYAGYRIYKTQNSQQGNNEEPEVVVEESIIKDIRLAITNYDTMNPLITSNKEILNIDTLVFGSESNDIDTLKNLANISNNDTNYHNKVKDYLNKGYNYPTAMSKALYDITNININTPNDLLALSYLKVINKYNYNTC